MDGGILNDQGPSSSLEEDLQVLGLEHMLGATVPSQLHEAEEEEEEERVDIEVRQEGEDEDDFDEALDNVTEEDDELDEDFIIEALAIFAEEEGLDEEEIDDLIEDDEWMDSFIEGLEDGLDEADEIDDLDEAAYDILEAFYTQLSEGEGEEIDRDALIGVIEAYEHLTGMPANLAEGSARQRGLRALRAARRKQKRMKRRGQMGAQAFYAARRGKKVVGGEAVKAGAGEVRALRKQMRGAGSRMRKLLKKRVKAAKKHTAASVKASVKGKKKGMAADVEVTSTPISELVDNISSLREAVTEGRETAEMFGELREGFDAISDTAATWMARIAEEVSATLDEDDDPEADPRVAVGRHLEGIANDAAAYVEMLDTGEVTADAVETFGEDLASLAADLEEAANAMKQID